MKKFKTIAALIMVAIMALSMATVAFGEYEDYAEYEGYAGYEGYGESLHMPHTTYVSITGEVINFIEDEEGKVEFVVIQGEYGEIWMRIDMNTAIPQRMPEKGDIVKAFYDHNAIMTMIYPPQHLAMAIIITEEDAPPSTFLGRFDEEWNSLDGQMHLVIGEDTEIFFQSQGQPGIGEAFDRENQDIEDLVGRKLLVEFGFQGRNMPPVHTPATRVIVLFERIAFGPEWISPELIDWDYDWGYDWDYDIFWDYDFDWDTYSEGVIWLEDFANYDVKVYPVTVNGVGLPGIEPITVGDSIWPNYLPLRPIMQHLGIPIAWNGDTREVIINSPQGEITFRIDMPYFAVAAEDGAVYTHTLDAPVIIDGYTFVPIRFFRDVFGFNNAYFASGVVVIDNNEVMQ